MVAHNEQKVVLTGIPLTSSNQNDSGIPIPESTETRIGDKNTFTPQQGTVSFIGVEARIVYRSSAFVFRNTCDHAIFGQIIMQRK